MVVARQQPEIVTGTTGDLETMAVQGDLTGGSGAGATGVAATDESPAPTEPIDVALGDDAALAGIAAGELDPCTRYALEHSGLGSSGIVGDCVALLGAVVLVAAARALSHATGDRAVEVAFGTTFLSLAPCVPVLAVFLTTTRRRSVLHRGFVEQVHSLALPLAAGGLAALAIWRGISAALGILPPRLDWVFALSVLSLTTVAGVRVLQQGFRRGQQRHTQRILILGSGTVADRVAQQFATHRNVKIVGFVDDDPVDPSRCLGSLPALSDICTREGVDHILVAFSRSQPQEIVDALRPLQGRLRITVVPRLFELLPTTTEVHELGSGLAGLSVAPATLGPWPRTVKRSLDLCIAGFGLLVLAPVLLAIAAGIRMTSSGPVLYRQVRIGRKGKQFSMLKFRTMRAELCDVSPSRLEGEIARGPFRKLKNDPRVTPFGRILRRTSVDELPQLWNVLCGEMAVVGPRPLMREDAAAIEGWALRRYSVRPGITGLWQVSGRNDVTFEEMCRLDQLYVNCWSIGLDLRTLSRTLWAVVSGRGAY